MKEIKIDDNFHLKIDEYNVSLYFESEEKKNKDGKLYRSKSAYHYPSIKTALQFYIQKSLETEKTVLDILRKIDLLENKIDQIKWQN